MICGSVVAILRNPISGSARKTAAVRELIAELRRLGLRPRLFSDRERLTEFVQACQARGDLRCVVAVGGDGTIGDVVNRFPGTPIATLPLGNVNLLAGFFDVPRCGRTVARLIAEGKTRCLDLGCVNGQRFTLMASLGFDAEVVERLHRCRTGPVSMASYARPIVETCWSYPWPELTVRVDDQSTFHGVRQVVVCNLPPYALRLRFCPEARADDGLLDVCLLFRGSVRAVLRYFVAVRMGWHVRLPDVRMLKARKIHVESTQAEPYGAARLQIDGDPAGRAPAEITVQPQALELFVP
ncbi:MAG: hypothetical protein GXP27_12525 [Planctomycetes bacterium]|nr:hypothetical protein [Planctomycetota bacterium]